MIENMLARGEQDTEPMAELVVPLWGIEDVMLYLGVSAAQVYRLSREHGLPYIKIGHKTLRFRKEAVEAWAIAHEIVEVNSAVS